LNDIWNNGFRSFEVDVRFGDNQITNFQVGHNHGVMGVSFEELINSVDYTKINRIWLDFKNLTVENHNQALQRLNYLDKKYNIKKNLIVESGTKKKIFQVFNQDGWHTSYCLPTDNIIKLLQKNDIKQMKVIANQISQQVKKQKLQAISFDHRLYQFVKKYLEYKISKKIVYHVWYAPPLKDIDFQDKLLQNKIYLDKRVKTLLSKYQSPFNL
jgi:heptose-I-phosphate ethanolaminephosphotransferase